MEWDKLFKVFSDNTRLRMLNLLNETELNVNELIEILNIQQSSASKHLKILKDQNLILERKDGTWRFYCLQKESLSSKMLQMLSEAWQDKIFEEDKSKINIVFEKRKMFAKDFFQSNIGKGLGDFYSFENLLVAFSMLLPANSRLLDAGCGSGKLMWYLAHNTTLDLYGIDIYKKTIDETVFKDASEKLKSKINISKADITDTKFDHNFFNIVFSNMVLHHVSQPTMAFQEIDRILKPGGKWIIIDFFKHNKEVMRSEYKDYWLGFTVDEIKNFNKNSNLKLTHHYLIPSEKTDDSEVPDNLIFIFEKN